MQFDHYACLLLLQNNSLKYASCKDIHLKPALKLYLLSHLQRQLSLNCLHQRKLWKWLLHLIERYLKCRREHKEKGTYWKSKSVNWISCIGNASLCKILISTRKTFIFTSKLKVCYQQTTLLVPRTNINSNTSKKFIIRILTDDFFKPHIDNSSILASDIFYFGPHGTKFDEHHPAAVRLPIGVAVEEDDVVQIWTSDTNTNDPTNWQILETEQIHVAGPFVEFQVTHFSLFAVVVSKRRKHVIRKIHRNIGGLLEMKDTNNRSISIYFEKASFHSSVLEASVELLAYDTFYVSGEKKDLLAAPIISLGPSGCQFTKQILVTIPLPKGKFVRELYGDTTLTFKYSQTATGYPPRWEIFYPKYMINWITSTVQFKVQHFTLFSVFWNLVDLTVPEKVKLHASSHIPHFSFWVSCQALMTRCIDREFGLCILCHRFGSSVTDLSKQYPIEVGQCKPRKIKSGKLKIKLKSGIFVANETVGESGDLSKVIDFDGHEVDIHYACNFASSAKTHSGVFGKVEVTPMFNEVNGFSFNLIKTDEKVGKKRNVSKVSIWENKMNKDLAEILSIDECMWHELAVTLGYNRYEIQNLFSESSEPINEILAHYLSRGGDEDEFSNAMYKVAQLFKILPVRESKESQDNKRIEMQRSSLSHRSNFGDDLRSEQTCFSKKRKYDEFNYNDPLTESKFDDIAGEIAKSWKSIGRKLQVSEPEIREIDLNYQHSGEREKAFQMLMSWKERNPESCIPFNLYKVLNDSGLKYTARKCFKS